MPAGQQNKHTGRRGEQGQEVVTTGTVDVDFKQEAFHWMSENCQACRPLTAPLQPEEEKGGSTGLASSYAATEPSQVGIQPRIRRSV
jgi:hypothetical protein